MFLDKDGTLVENIPYNADPDLIRLVPGAEEALALFSRQGFRLLVVTNQPGVALGFVAESAMSCVERRLRELIEEAGARLDGFYYCPHSPRGNLLRYTRECDCRKPRPGLLQRAALECGIALSQSWMIGDILDDVEAGRLAGCRTALIDNGNETEWEVGPDRTPDCIATDLCEAATLVLRAERARARMSERR